jgi:hypothetical protein
MIDIQIRAIFRMTESKEARNGAATPPFGKVMPEEVRCPRLSLLARN